MSADNEFNEVLERYTQRATEGLRKHGYRSYWWRRPSTYAKGGEVAPRPTYDDSIPVRLSEGGVITDPDEAEALGLTVDAQRLRGPGAMWHPSPCNHHEYYCPEDARFGSEFCGEHEITVTYTRAEITTTPAASLDPWTAEMLAAIADANEAYEDGIDCE